LGDAVSDEEHALFKAYRLMLESDTLIDAVTRHIEAGLWAPAALREAIQEQRHVFETMDDAYLRERAQDIRDLGRRLLLKLQHETPQMTYPADTILAGEEIDAIQLAEVPRDRLRGVLTQRGSMTSHVAILARALGIPAVLGVTDLPVARLDGQAVVLDGYRGRAYLTPPASLIADYQLRLAYERQLTADLLAIAPLPAVTPDGVRVELQLNTGLLADLDLSLQCGAEGVGLYRTEFPYLVRDAFPTEATQTQIYQQVLTTFAPRPVVMRTLDIGGDKQPNYFLVCEANPFLGWRGIRISLDHPDMLLAQLRAMLRASVGLENLRLLLPMVSLVAQVDQALALLHQAHAELCAEGLDVVLPPVGVMIEVPAAACQLAALAKRVAFFSIGTNDLTQYLLAVDRNNAQVAPLFDSLHPAVLTVLQWITQAAQRHGRPLSVCGELGGDPLGAVLLLGMGVTQLSMAAGSLLRVKWIIRHFPQRLAAEVLVQALACESGNEVRALTRRAVEQAGLGHLLTQLE
jgi:phosphotransferase system enzyme I (PtsP)